MAPVVIALRAKQLAEKVAFDAQPLKGRRFGRTCGIAKAIP